jgi:hypothetical protein
MSSLSAKERANVADVGPQREVLEYASRGPGPFSFGLFPKGQRSPMRFRPAYQSGPTGEPAKSPTRHRKGCCSLPPICGA